MNTSVTIIFELTQLNFVIGGLIALSVLDEVHSHTTWSSISTIIRPEIGADVIILDYINVCARHAGTMTLFWSIRIAPFIIVTSD